MFNRRIAAFVAACFLVASLASSPLSAAEEGAKDAAKDAAKEAKDGGKPDELKLPPFPADKTVHQTTQVGGKTVAYDATVGSLPILDEKGKTIADVMFVAYTVPGS